MRQTRFAELIPPVWLMTDKRNDAMLEQSIRQLPHGSGIIFRHYHLPPDMRRARFRTVRRLARRHDHLLLLAGSPALARSWGADGVHGRGWKRRDTEGLLHSAPVHNRHEIAEANRNGADLFFLSPVYPTRSHPGGKTLRRGHLSQLAQLCTGPVILLGGMTAARFRQHQGQAEGWAAIDGLSA